MSRWVDEEWLLDYFADDIDYYGKYVREDIKDNMPSIEIIRCGECKHWSQAPKIYKGWCDRLDGLLDPDWFCADGEREGE